MKRLGRNWKRLHKWVYLAGVLAVVHFSWVRKVDFDPEPFIYGGILALLLLARVPIVRKYLSGVRQKFPGRAPGPVRQQPKHQAATAKA
jgi:sulfoxide reductase heme-binding subunit YedZ